MRKRSEFGALILGTLILVGGVPVSAQMAGKTEKVILASGLGPPYIHYITAVDGNIMKKYGVNAEYKIFPSGVEAIIAVGAGEAHVSNGSCSTVMRAKANGSKILIVARNIVNPDEHKFIVAQEIKKPEDLKGKKIGMLVGSSTDWYATKYLKAFGLKEGSGPDEVTLLNIAAPEWIPALQRKDIVGFFGWEPWVTRVQSIVQGAHVLHNGGDNGLFILMNCMVFNSDWIKNDPASAEATMRGLVETHDVISANREQAIGRAAVKMRIPAKDLGDMAKCCTYKVDFTPDFVEHVTEAAGWAGTKGMLKQETPATLIRELLYPDLLRKVAAGRVTVR